MSNVPGLPNQPPSSDQGGYFWSKTSGTWQIMFPLLIVGGLILGAVSFENMVTFNNGITIANKNGIIYNGHFNNFTNNTGTLVQKNGTFSGTVNINGHISTFPSLTGTLCQVNQTGACGTGGSFSYNVTRTNTNSSVNTGSQILIVNATGSHSTTITLPTASGISTFITIIKVNNSTNIVHINTTGTDHIEGGIKFKNLVVQNSKITLQPSVLANGTGWYFDIGSGNQ